MKTRFKLVFTSETYWKEQLIGILAFLLYGAGNLIEYIFKEGINDPSVIWVTGLFLSVLLIWISISKYKKYTPDLFKLMLLFGNFNIIFAYGESTKAPIEDEALYLLFAYAVFIISSQAIDLRRDLITLTIFEVFNFTIVTLINRDEDPLLLDHLQLLLFAFILGGNFLIGLQRLRLTQIAGGSSIQFRMLSENARDTQSVINLRFNFMYVNPSVTQLSGYELNELNGKSFLTLVSDADKEKVKNVLSQLSTHADKRQSIEYRIKTKSGTQVWVESIFSLFKPDPNLSTEFIFSETRNIETRKKLEEEIQKQLQVEEMLIKHSNQFINLERMEIQQGINVALGEFGKMLGAEGVMVYRLTGKLQDEFRSSNQWFSSADTDISEHFNPAAKVEQPLIAFLRTMRGNKSSHGDFISTSTLNAIGLIKTSEIFPKTFYIIPLQSGNVVNGFVVFVFDENVKPEKSNFFGLIGNMIANAFTRLRTEIRLHEAQLSNEFILRALPDWLYIINKNGDFTGSNNYSTLAPYISDYDLMEKNFGQVMPENISSLFTKALNEVIETDVSASFEYQDTAHHKGRFFKVIIAPFKANEYLLIIRDITDLKTAQNELEAKAQKLELSNKELEEFAYIVSHDLKQPVRTIIGYLSLITKRYGKTFNEELAEFFQFCTGNANKMYNLIEDILKYSKLEQQIEFAVNISLNDMVKKVLTSLQQTITTNNAEVICDDLPMVKGNETLLSEVFQNLIENGIKYNKNEKRIVNIKVADETTHWKFSISDNGIGFDQQYAEQIFKIFKRLHITEEFQGTGIGLSICQKAIEKHRGKIWAESERGKGSTFYFTLPK